MKQRNPSVVRRTSSLAIASTLALAATSSAQSPAGEATPIGSTDVSLELSRGGAGLAVVDGRVHAIGDGWKAELGRDRIRFTPALGTESETNRSLVWSFESISRGGERCWTPDVFDGPALDDLTARYHRGEGVIERYDARPEGLELSFVLPHELGDGGDLVLRGRLNCDLEADLGRTRDPLGFRLDGRDAITIGTVTAIDADGRRSDGELGYDGTHLDLVVPASFLADARWPLIVDPLIQGPNFEVTGAEATEPDVAYDASSGRYLVTWTQRMSVFDLDIRARGVTTTGLVDAEVIPIESTAFQAFDSAVGNLDSRDEFFVAYSMRSTLFTDSDLVGRFVDAHDPSGGVGPTHVLDDTSGANADQVDVASTWGSGSSLHLVWRRDGVGIRHTRVVDNGVLAPLVFQSTSLFDSATARDPRMATSGGASQDRIVAWREFYASPAPGDHDVMVGMVAENGSLLGAVDNITTLGVDERAPHIDGDGEQFLLLYDRENGPYDGFAYREVTWNGTTIGTGDENVEWHAAPFGVASTAYSGYDFINCLTDGNAFDDLHFRAIDPFTFGVYFLNGIPGALHGASEVAMAMGYHGTGLAAHDGLIVWSDSDPQSGLPNIMAKLVKPGLGIDEAGGGCGEAGSARTGLPTLGETLTFALEDGPAFAPAILVIGFADLNLPCGPCTLVPSTAGAIFHSTTISLSGEAQYQAPLPIDPALGGTQVWSQWLTVDLFSPACDQFPADLSDAHALTLLPAF